METRKQPFDRKKALQALFQLVIAGSVIADGLLGVTPRLGFGLSVFEGIGLAWWTFLLFKSLSHQQQTRLASVLLVLVAWGAFASKVYLLVKGASLANGLYRTYLGTLVVLASFGWVSRGHRLAFFLAASASNPSRTLFSSVATLALFGGFLLETPLALVDPNRASPIDAFFDATGALCGALGTTDVGRTYRLFGHIVLLVLMQIGGLGIMVLTAALTLVVGKSLDVKRSASLAEVLDADSLAGLRRIVRTILVWTFTIETLGALGLYYFLRNEPGNNLPAMNPHPLAGGHSAAFSAIFHSVSAFCNAGFSLYRDNLGYFRSHSGVNIVVSALIIVGGLGFPVLLELQDRFVNRVRRIPQKMLSLHSRVVLLLTPLLLLVGTIGILLLEAPRSFRGLPFSTAFWTAFFQTTSARTAGLSTIDLTTLSSPSLLLLIVLMFIGTAPGGTGGGAKLTTLAVLFATFRAEQTGAPAPTLFQREVPMTVQRKALVVAFLSLLLVLAATFLLLVVANPQPLHALFDVTSAFASCGLSVGTSNTVGSLGKLVLILTMLIGRVGPLTFALAAANTSKPVLYRLPEERVMIG